MNVKLFSHLLMAHLLSDWWHIFGRCADLKKLEEEDLEVLKLLTTNSYLHQAVRKHIGLLRRDINRERLRRDDVITDLRLNLRTVYGIKLRDWIVEAERDFPLWLSDLDINRFIKWVLALNFAQEPIFDDLRRFLEENVVTIETFANEMCLIYEEMSEKFAHELPGIEDPTPDRIPQVCEIVARNNECRQLTCSVLLKAKFVRTKSRFTCTTLYFTTNTHYFTKVYSAMRKLRVLNISSFSYYLFLAWLLLDCVFRCSINSTTFNNS
ncbi:uncharacterized protein LOC135844638 isoform X1 [Planococcus citri]|uniref:uncharacterized protein LOC135844638 isoform X1 n=1 Tax=Planococcus citri TaxID=170843 RepID=UPI0031F7AD6B